MTGMPERDALEFATGVVIGTVIGAALALLVAPDRSPPARVRRRLQGPRRRVRRRARDTRTAAAVAARRSVGLGRALHTLGDEFVAALREEFLDRGLRARKLGASQKRGAGKLSRAPELLRAFRRSPGRTRGAAGGS